MARFLMDVALLLVGVVMGWSFAISDVYIFIATAVTAVLILGIFAVLRIRESNDD